MSTKTEIAFTAYGSKHLTLYRQTQHICNVSTNADLCANTNSFGVTSDINRFVTFKQIFLYVTTLKFFSVLSQKAHRVEESLK